MADGGDGGGVRLDGLEPDALRVLGCLADRMRVGRGIYGDLVLESDKRNPSKELGEELADALVYHAIGILKGYRDAERRVNDLLAKCTEQRNEIVALKAERDAALAIIDALENTERA